MDGVRAALFADSHSSRRIAWVALAIAVSGLVAFGVAGVARGANVHFADVRYFWLAGKLTAAGVSPYEVAAFEAAAAAYGLGPPIDLFAYPPHGLALCVALSWLPVETARWAWTLGNLGLLAATAWTMAVRFEHRAGARVDAAPSAAALWIAAITLGNPFAMHLIWTAQTGLIVLSCLLLAWHFERRGRWLLAGILLGLATLKPQLGLLAFAWFVITGSWRVAAAATASAGLLLLFAVAQIGSEVLVQWPGAARDYETQLIGALSYNTNLKSLLLGLGLDVPHAFTALMVVAALALVALLAHRHRRQPMAANDVQAVLLATSLFLVQGRDYDLAVLAPLVVMLFWHGRGNALVRWAGLAALLLLCIPHRGLAQSGLPILPLYRIAILGALWAWAVWLIATTRLRPGAPPAPLTSANIR